MAVLCPESLMADGRDGGMASLECYLRYLPSGMCYLAPANPRLQALEPFCPPELFEGGFKMSVK